jgi:hypothetical protein
MDFVFGGASEAIFEKLMGASLTVEVAGISVASSSYCIVEGAGFLVAFSRDGIAEGAGILVVWSSRVGITEGAGILVVWSSRVGITEGPGICVGPNLDLNDEGPADGAVERVSFEKSFEKSFLDDIVYLFYESSKNVKSDEG